MDFKELFAETVDLNKLDQIMGEWCPLLKGCWVLVKVQEFWSSQANTDLSRRTFLHGTVHEIYC
jgi:hypothetical protein